MYIYLIKNTAESYYKIGVAKTPQTRLSQLQTGNSDKLVIIEAYETDYAHKIERILHRNYSHLKKEGEWFNFSIVEEQKFLNDCQRIEKMLGQMNEFSDSSIYI